MKRHSFRRLRSDFRNHPLIDQWFQLRAAHIWGDGWTQGFHYAMAHPEIWPPGWIESQKDAEK